MNVVMIDDGRMIEVQGTAEGAPFSHEELLAFTRPCERGLEKIFGSAKEALKQ